MSNKKSEIIEAILNVAEKDTQEQKELEKLTKEQLLDILSTYEEIPQDDNPQDDKPQDDKETTPATKTLRIGDKEINLETGETKTVQKDIEPTSTDKSGYIQALPTNKLGFTPLMKLVGHGLFFSPKEYPHQQQQLAKIYELFLDLTAYPEPFNRPFSQPLLPVVLNPEYINFVAENVGFIILTARYLRDSKDFRKDLIELLKTHQPQ